MLAAIQQASVDHYENFPVASWLCPARLRPAVVAIYHFARTADDLADEGNATAEQRLEDLHQYRAELELCLSGQAPQDARWVQVFANLQSAVRAFDLPAQPLRDLLSAFEQDVSYTSIGHRYRDRAELMDYCRRSANPVGRLMLHLYGVSNAQSLAQSDAICSALQLINFWQDRTRDLKWGRDYLPQGSTLGAELQFARTLMGQGAPLVHRVPGRAGWELRAMVQGGLCILGKVDALYAAEIAQLSKKAQATQQREALHGYVNDASLQLPRPVITKWDMAGMAWKCLWM
ncbi:MAG: squalene/phytoene synthase family protein [Burkholderiales bacterium]|nr:squalene/phytoene synthase family protein [Burkholderiales bacterium]